MNRDGRWCRRPLTDERRAARQLQAKPLLYDLERWLHATLFTLSRKSDTAAAILYALKLWPTLIRYADDGRIEIDNSAAERALRGVALGRRNYLFAGADSGGERATAMYGLIGTAPPSWPAETPLSVVWQASSRFPLTSSRRRTADAYAC